jgi:hypothetical protein
MFRREGGQFGDYPCQSRAVFGGILWSGDLDYFFCFLGSDGQSDPVAFPTEESEMFEQLFEILVVCQNVEFHPGGLGLVVAAEFEGKVKIEIVLPVVGNFDDAQMSPRSGRHLAEAERVLILPAENDEAIVVSKFQFFQRHHILVIYKGQLHCSGTGRDRDGDGDGEGRGAGTGRDRLIIFQFIVVSIF